MKAWEKIKQQWEKLPDVVKTGGVVLGIFLVIIGISYWTHVRSPTYSHRTRAGLKDLMREAKYGSLMAEQDRNPLARLLHLYQALCYTKAAQTIARSDLDNICNTDIDQFMENLEWEEEDALNFLFERCPSLRPTKGATANWLL